MSQHHQVIKNDPRWKAAKAAAHERDGWACVGHGDRAGVCENDGPLQADHIVRLEDGGEAFDLDNLQTLCVPCHQQKEREYVRSRLIRNTWINPQYPELSAIFGISTESDVPVF